MVRNRRISRWTGKQGVGRSADERIKTLINARTGDTAGYLVLAKHYGTVPIGPFATLATAKRAQRDTMGF